MFSYLFAINITTHHLGDINLGLNSVVKAQTSLNRLEFILGHLFELCELCATGLEEAKVSTSGYIHI